jgi:hypothetical protein
MKKEIKDIEVIDPEVVSPNSNLTWIERWWINLVSLLPFKK